MEPIILGLTCLVGLACMAKIARASGQHDPVQLDTIMEAMPQHSTRKSTRRANLKDITQALVALIVIASNMVVLIYSAVMSSKLENTTLTNAMFVVIMFYFERTRQRAGHDDDSTDERR